MKNSFRSLCRFSVVFLAVLLLISGFAGGTQASAREYVPDTTPVQVSGNYAYKLYTGGTLEIVDYSGQEADIVIPSELAGNPVTTVGSEAFAYYEMKSLTIPEGVSVSGRAFEYCEISDFLSLPKGIVIETRAFEYASLPEAVVIPEDARIDGDCFSYCEDLETLFVSAGATLKGDAFSYSEDLKTLVCAPGSTVAEDAFYDSARLAGVLLCGNVTLGEDPFPYCGRAKLLTEDAEQFTLELEKVFGPLSGVDTQPQPDTRKTGKRIGKEAAMKIALADSGVEERRVGDVEVELERTTGGEYYEVEFDFGAYEYEYRIDAVTGEVLYARREMR